MTDYLEPRARVELATLLSCKNPIDLDECLQNISRTFGYFEQLNVSWNNWHYGRHADHAKLLGMLYLSDLMILAWAKSFDLKT